MRTNKIISKIVDVCDEWQKEQKLARLLEEIGYNKDFAYFIILGTNILPIFEDFVYFKRFCLFSVLSNALC